MWCALQSRGWSIRRIRTRGLACNCYRSSVVSTNSSGRQCTILQSGLCACACACACVGECACMCVRACVCVCRRVCVRARKCECVHVFVCVCKCLCVCLPASASASSSLSLSAVIVSVSLPPVALSLACSLLSPSLSLSLSRRLALRQRRGPELGCTLIRIHINHAYCTEVVGCLACMRLMAMTERTYMQIPSPG